MKTVAIMLLSLLLIGCATQQKIVYVDRPVEVKVPVIVQPPAAPAISEPFLPIWLLNDTSTDSDVARAYHKTIIILESYGNVLQCALDAYRTTGKMCKEDAE